MGTQTQEEDRLRREEAEETKKSHSLLLFCLFSRKRTKKEYMGILPFLPFLGFKERRIMCLLSSSSFLIGRRIYGRYCPLISTHPPTTCVYVCMYVCECAQISNIHKTKSFVGFHLLLVFFILNTLQCVLFLNCGLNLAFHIILIAYHISILNYTFSYGIFSISLFKLQSYDNSCKISYLALSPSAK